MDPAKFVSEQKKLAGSNATLKIMVAALFVGLIVNAFVSYSMSKRVRTVILPPVVSDRIELSGVTFSDAYLRVMARYIMGLARNYTPSSVRGNFDELLALFDPSVYAENKTRLYTLASTIETARVTSVWTPDTISWNEGKREIVVRGSRKEYVGEQKTSDAQESYAIGYSNSNGRFGILRIAQVDLPAGQKGDTK
jgi:conjugal transfer pilus assembly protein TraE